MAPNQQKPSRIPLALQVIFLHSNRGYRVDKPPPERQASKIFRRGLFFKKPVDPKSKTEADSSPEETKSMKTQETSSVSTLCKGDADEHSVSSDEVLVQAAKQEGLAIAEDKSKTSALNEQDDEDDDGEDDSERKGTENNDESDQDYSGNQSDSDFIFAAYEAEMEGLLQLLDFRLESSRRLLST
jgi:hypothetical protein